MVRKAGIPMMLAVAVVFGLALGMGLGKGRFGQRPEWQKIDQIMQYAEHDYVDTVSRHTLEDEVIAYLLQRLDPHSVYIPENEVAAMTEPLEGGFEGVGIQFNLEDDTIYVVRTINGGPSEKAGIMAGDRIVAVNGNALAGQQLTSADVMTLLKGSSGSQVKVVALRGQQRLVFTLTRGEVPLRSIEAAYLLNDSTIYVRLARFAKTTAQEFQTVVYPLQSTATKHFILDLRGNGGGFLEAAVSLADEFLPEGALITYTKGKARPRTDFHATREGRFTTIALHVIIDGQSASASEVFSGAVQDHRRATIYGQRSFGKGLVQEQSDWADGSATRLTVARYYTPKGRSIQRPYQSFGTNNFDPFAPQPDSGGIVPDVHVERDTSGITWLYAELVHRGWLTDFAYQYRDQHIETLAKLPFEVFLREMALPPLMQSLRGFLDNKAYVINETEWVRSEKRIAQRVTATIARSLYDEEGYYRVMNPTDVALHTILSGIKKPEL